MTYNAKDGMKPMIQGRAAEHRVAAEVLLRGHIPAFPEVDFGFDMVLDNTLRIQVKSARLQKHPQYPLGVYRFSFRRDMVGKSVGPEGKKQYRKYLRSEPRDYKKVADFFVLWGIDEDRFWIIPCSNKPRDLFIFTKDAVKQTPWLDYVKIKTMRDSGMNNCQIGREFNVSHTTIRLAFTRGISKFNDKTGLRFAMTCENRWDLLDVNKAVEATLSGTIIEKAAPNFALEE